jgi:hypothetical protein
LFTYTLDRIALLLRDRNRLRTGRERHVVVSILSKQGEELLRVLGDELRKLRVAGAQLLQNGLEHLWLLLHDLAELLELGVVSEELEVAGALRASRGSAAGRRCGGLAARAALLSREIEEVHVALVTASRGSCRRRRGGCSRRRGALLLGRLGDSLFHQEIALVLTSDKIEANEGEGIQ